MGILRTQGSQPWGASHGQSQGKRSFRGTFTYKGPETEESPCVCVVSLFQDRTRVVSWGEREVGDGEGPVSS